MKENVRKITAWEDLISDLGMWKISYIWQHSIDVISFTMLVRTLTRYLTKSVPFMAGCPKTFHSRYSSGANYIFIAVV